MGYMNTPSSQREQHDELPPALGHRRGAETSILQECSAIEASSIFSSRDGTRRVIVCCYAIGTVTLAQEALMHISDDDPMVKGIRLRAHGRGGRVMCWPSVGKRRTPERIRIEPTFPRASAPERSKIAGEKIAQLASARVKDLPASRGRGTCRRWGR